MIKPYTTIRNKNNVAVISYLLFSSICFFSCGQQGSGQQKPEERMAYYNNQQTYYDLLAPDKVYKLPDKVAEISGLSLVEEKKEILFLDDESGKMYVYDLEKKKIDGSMRFWKNADFEGIELIGKRVFALKSDGDLISFGYENMKISEGKREGTILGKKNDTEGLGYDAKNDVLLIACKEKGDLKDKEVAGRVVYAYDYNTGILNEKPIIQVRWLQIKKFLDDNNGNAFIKDSRKFKPSGIALHPLEDTYYVLSSSGKSMIIFDRAGAIVGYYTVPRSVLEQPEGICFASNGDLYLSSEGVDKKARIAKFILKSK